MADPAVFHREQVKRQREILAEQKLKASQTEAERSKQEFTKQNPYPVPPVVNQELSDAKEHLVAALESGSHFRILGAKKALAEVEDKFEARKQEAKQRLEQKRKDEFAANLREQERKRQLEEAQAIGKQHTQVAGRVGPVGAIMTKPACDEASLKVGVPEMSAGVIFTWLGHCTAFTRAHPTHS